MTGRVLTLVLAAVSMAPGVPIEETFYQILGPDQTTVLCDSRTTGSCDPFLTQFDVFGFSVDSDFIVSPIELRADTEIHSFGFNSDSLADHFVRVSHFFEDEIDLGWYAFEGGTGDFLAQYSVPSFGDPPFFGDLSGSIDPGPFPLGHDIVEVGATFGQPFRVRGHYMASFDALLSATLSFPQGGGVHVISQFTGSGRHPDGTPQFPVQVVPVPIPEPGGLALFGLSAILGTVAMRKYRSTSHD